MKRLFGLIAISLSMIVFSCDKSSDKISTMQAKVNDTLIVCDSSVYIVESLTSDHDLYGIRGFKKGATGFTLAFPIGSGVGTYQFKTFNRFGTENIASFSSDDNNQFIAQGGSVTVTEATKSHFKGTFTFPSNNIRDTNFKRNITEGEFDVYH
jgi:hypothetical protein